MSARHKALNSPPPENWFPKIGEDVYLPYRSPYKNNMTGKVIADLDFGVVKIMITFRSVGNHGYKTKEAQFLVSEIRPIPSIKKH